MATLAEFKTAEKSWWCPGCGDFGVLAALQQALVNLSLEPENLTIIAGIGCSGKIGNYVNGYNFHVVHGRTLPTAQMAKLANRDLTVLAIGGDGDGFAIGMSHYMHAMRRNINITYIVMDNHIYGLTKGQISPASDPGMKTKYTTEAGNIERPVMPLELAVSAGATFVAQGYSSKTKDLSLIIEAAIKHNGFSFVNAISPCVTYNMINTFDFYKEKLSPLDPGYDRHDKLAALKAIHDTNSLLTGIIYEEEGVPAYDDLIPGFRPEPIVKQDLTVPREFFEKIKAGLG